MTSTLDLWLDANIDTVINHAGCLADVRHDREKIEIQLMVMRKHIDEMICFIKKYGSPPEV